MRAKYDGAHTDLANADVSAQLAIVSMGDSDHEWETGGVLLSERLYPIVLIRPLHTVHIESALFMGP